MAGRLTFHAFTELGWTDGEGGAWRNPALTPPRTVPELEFWTGLARVAERGRLDSFFFADAMGMGGFTPSDQEREVRDGRLILWDPAVAIPALAAATEHIGFLFTSSILQEHPFTFARKASTLDHLTNGRVGWNIVTSYSPNVARNFGMDDLPPREERYRWADEYVDVAYRLWEGSWEEDAVVADAATGVYVDPAKVHPIDYAGERYRVQGPHLTYATPQRTPLLVQAGGSPAGRAFAARHAEMQFITAPDPESAAKDIAAVRRLAARAGRRPDDICFTISTGFVVGSTEEEARRKADDLDSYADFAGKVAAISTSIGVDLTGLEPDAPVSELLAGATSSGGMSGVLKSLIGSLPTDRPPTLRDLIRPRGDRHGGVGTPEQIADQLERWQRAGVGGVAVGMDVRPGSLTDFVDHVIPVLQDRGLAQREYAPGTLRQRVLGYGDRLPDRHPAARHRRGSRTAGERHS
ncbi:NtaA/DmoA family FMN-dependent monooxygenase [Amycolatopsis sp. NPDC004079]|uniref:NtaA/DmoA family FMN-dependent monooxygenase n=1 Tax=Amycolatopsis sp. NPDC004079 TaxID=3154549 RepID=UPI0033B37AC6